MGGANHALQSPPGSGAQNQQRAGVFHHHIPIFILLRNRTQNMPSPVLLNRSPCAALLSSDSADDLRDHLSQRTQIVD
jgi:hypothetical protein